ncbi:aminopeptidase N [Pseudohoeflea coraliihabitans]|uniref:Aminopeptidase N n=1 Tax=Pseudohoeflea coraliihabitans TaxID=2860393 RepID=A0ABS6WRU5_9HYPH|nr:aminopeptidase N [Pseudohoeflea sp. DP4N28-3]MBW3098686.1 aminopeptidase N [Pseudohoeflea sp. DP4N28-3]
MGTEESQVIHLKDYTPTDFEVERIDLTFELDPKATKVVARSILKRRAGVAADRPLVFAGDALTLKALQIDSIDVSEQDFDATPDELVIRGLPESEAFEVTVETELSPDANTTLMGLYRSGGNYCTQCEAEGFRRITYFYDRPDVLTVYTVTIIADESVPQLLSNGNFLGGGAYGDGRHFAAWHDPYPKPSYLFALVAGDLGVIEDTFTTMSGREVALKIYVEHGKEARATYAMDALKRSMRWDEEVYGREYDLDIFMIVAVSDFNMGAMENKGLNVFNDKYVLADPETATDQDYANIEAIIAHEYFHNWTGNRITCRDWFQLCLKEGLTVYRDHTFSQDQRSAPVKRIAEIKTLKAHQFPEDAGPLAHPVRPSSYKEINNFYTTTIYEKGSEVIGMLRTILGADDFRAGMDLYFERHDGQAVTIEDFIACFAEVSARDLGQFMLWYTQAGTPTVTVSTEYDRDKQRFTVTLEQNLRPTPGQPQKQPMHIPLGYALMMPNGTAVTGAPQTAAASDTVLHLTERNESFVFDGVEDRPVLSINRGFSAPVNILMESRADDLVALARHESDGVARWQAITELATRHLVKAAGLARDNAALPESGRLADILIAVAGDATLEPAFRAQVLALPSEADVAREIGKDIDPDAIHRARRETLRAIAAAGQRTFSSLADDKPSGPFSPAANDAGRRALAGMALRYTALAENDAQRLAEAYANADNMTDRINALTVLAHDFEDAPETQAALDQFAERYADTPLAIDKWFTVQATAPGAESHARVVALMQHPGYTRGNPNRVRALLGAFAAGNPTGFNRADGAGYRLLADEVLAIDRKNPQLAARLLTAMRSWQSLESGRREEARKALVAISSAGDLSVDLSDIVERTLQ